MEARFGHDFSRVRVHVDSRAVESAEALNARAFTNGRHIVFGRGEYAPGTTGGDRLIAHELAHVIQQGTSHELLQRNPASPADPAEETDTVPESAESWFYEADRIGHIASLYFDTGSAALDADNAWVIELVSLLLTQPDPPAKVILTGHTDSVGDAASNQALSQRRAEEVENWLLRRVSGAAIEVNGLGEQGPEATAENAAELSHYRRVDVVIEPPRGTTRPDPRKGGGSKYGSAELKAAMPVAVQALNSALTALDQAIAGTPTDPTTAALARYFPHPRYRSAEFLATLKGDIEHVRDHIDSVEYDEVQGNEFFVHCSTNPYRDREGDWPEDFCKAINAASTTGHPAFVFPKDSPNRIVLIPGWRRNPASIVIHEAAHLMLGLIGHPTEIPHRNPYAIQGFVAAVGGLTAPSADKRYPEPTP